MSHERNERVELAHALKAVTDRAPLITRGVVNASQSSKPLAWRRGELDGAISQARALYDELLLHKVRLGWHNRGNDA